MPRNVPTRSTTRIPAGQLFITRDFKLTSVVQTWYADQTMDNSSFIRRNARKAVTDTTTTSTTSIVLEEEDVPAVTSPADHCETIIQDIEDVFDPSQECGQLETAEMEQHESADHLQPEEADTSSDEDVIVTPLPPLRPPKRSLSPSIMEEDNNNGRKRRKNVPMTIASFLFMILPIRLGAYAAAYRKYHLIARKKCNKQLLHILHSVLSYWGDILPMKTSQSSLQNVLKEDIDSGLYTTVCPAGIQKKLSDWLTEYTMVKTDVSETCVSEKQGSCSSDFIIPKQPSPIICTSSTIADGRVPPAAASPSLPYPGLQDSDVAQELSANYRPKTSGMLRSMSWRDTAYRYSLRSKGNSGDRIVKLEIYNSSEVMGIPSTDWWKHAETKAFVMCDRSSATFNQAIQLKHHLRKTLEQDPHHEGDYVQLKF